MKTLTLRRRAILAAIWKSGKSPSRRELMRATGNLSSSDSHIHLNALKLHGYLTWPDGQGRTLTLTGKGLLAAQGYELNYTCDQDGIKLA